MKLSHSFISLLCVFVFCPTSYAANADLIQNVKNLSYMAVPPTKEELKSYQENSNSIQHILNDETMFQIANQDINKIENKLKNIEDKLYMNQLDNEHTVISELMKISFTLMVMEKYQQETNSLYENSLLQSKITYLKKKTEQLFSQINARLNNMYEISPNDFKYAPAQNLSVTFQHNNYTKAALNAFIQNGIPEQAIKNLNVEKLDSKLLEKIYLAYLLSLD